MSIVFMNKTENVVTVSGKEVVRSSCIEHKKTGTFYEFNVDCFKVKDDSARGWQWYRVNAGKIAWNVEAKEWQFIGPLRENNDLIEGIISEDGRRGYFSSKREYVTAYEYYEDRVPSFIINEKVTEALGYIPCKWDDIYYKKKNLKLTQYKEITTPRVKRYKNLQFNYSADEKNPAYRTIKKIYADIVMDVPERTIQVSKFLYNKGFGLEFESSNGTLKEKQLGALGLVPLKDGSLRKPDGTEPYEYTTVPLSEAKGLETIKSICKELNDKCEFDVNCSLHIHIGNIKWDTLSIIAYYILAQRVQDELYSVFPLYKKDEMKYAGKPKNYNQPLPNIGILGNKIFTKDKDQQLETQANFNKIFEHLTCGQLTRENIDYNLTNAIHPLGNTKWAIASR